MQFSATLQLDGLAVEGAKTPETRDRRIAKILSELS